MLKKAINLFFRRPDTVPSSVQLDITTVCNFKCKMCPIHFVKQEHKHIDYDVFTTIVDNIEGVEEIALVGLGEPFTFPRIHDAVRYCRSKGMTVKTTSNGSLLNTDEKIRDMIESGLHSLTFSIDSINGAADEHDGHDSKNILKNIERIIEIRDEMGSPTPKITLQSVLQKDRESDVYDVIRWGAARKVHRINVLRMHMYFDNNIERHSYQEEKVVHRELAKLRKELGVRIDCLQDQFFTGFKGFLYKHLKYFMRLDTFCVRLLDYPLISQEGEIIPCCALPRITLGNVLESSLAELWHGEKMNEFRRVHQKNPICSKCDNWRIHQIV